ncbi:MAG: hypothetical protein CSA47_00345 [Gammaproteobacteria bacterium]|nr:MAG: hypothetical protein CSA47_00345 [Gammaproteobacteria bacterium]
MIYQPTQLLSGLLITILSIIIMTATAITPVNQTNEQKTMTTDTNIIKSDNDQRDYAYTKLDNGLKLLVISDKAAQRSAAAVDVYVGSSAEPDEFPGLAHFLEHMLFLGTDQYPDPDDYINYISDHGGNHNAFTAFDHTNYFFDIDPDHLHEGLKRFSRFFVAPLMSAKYVERERNAVDSEFQSKLREDGWRSMDVLKQATNPKHPYSRFSVGNNDTLPNDTVRPALLNFYRTYYSADRMSAIIIGKEDASTLTQWGKTLFADVPLRPTADTHIGETLFDGIALPIKIKSQSVKNERNLSLYFHLPYDINNDYNKSLNYLSYVLGYEGKGSLLEALKQLGYASKLYAGAGYRIGDETSFEIGVQLTDKGYANQQDVIGMIFAYIDLLKNDTNAEARYREIATVAKTAFQFKEKRNAIHEVSMLSTYLNRYPARDVQALSAIFTGYDQAQINRHLALMSPEQAVVQITAPNIEANNTTQYFRVPYDISPVEATVLTTLSDKAQAAVNTMHLPEPNPFLATNYTLQQDATAEKTEVLANGIELYYKNDTSFKVPRSSVQIALQPDNTLSITDKTVMYLLAALVDEQLTTTLYDASVAGLHGEITAGEKSIAISLEGYQEKMPELLKRILRQLRSPAIDQATFERVKNDYRQDLENVAAQMPYQQTFPYLNKQLVEDASVPDERLAVLDKITEQTLAEFAKQTLSELAVRMMVYGNSTYDEAKQLAVTISDELPNSNLQHQWQANHAKLLSNNESQSFKIDHDDYAITLYIQAGEGYRARGQMGLLGKMIEPLFFTKLRTEMQLGYIVFAYPRPTLNRAGIAFTIQSPVANTDKLKEHIETFNQQFCQSLQQLREDEFVAIKTILKRELLQKPENLADAAHWYWADILTTGKTQSSRQAISQAIDKITRSDFVDQATNVLQNGYQVTITAQPEKK